MDGDPRPSVGASKEKGFHAFRANVGKPSQAVVPLSLAPSSSALQCASYCSLEGEQAPSALQGDRTWSEMPRRVTFHRCRMTMSNTETSTFNTIVTIKTLPPTGSLPAQRWHAMLALSAADAAREMRSARWSHHTEARSAEERLEEDDAHASRCAVVHNRRYRCRGEPSPGSDASRLP